MKSNEERAEPSLTRDGDPMQPVAEAIEAWLSRSFPERTSGEG